MLRVMNHNSGLPKQEDSRTRFSNFGIVWSSQSLTAMLIFVVPALAPLIVSSFNLSLTEIGVIVGLTYVGVSTMSTLFGAIADILGIRKVLFLGHLIEAVAIIGASVAHSFAGLALAIFGVGVGYGSITPVTSKAILDWFPSKQRKSVMGLKQTGVTVGGAVAGFVFPTIGVKFGLEASFLVGGILVMLGSVILLGYVEIEKPQGGGLAFLREGLSRSLRNVDLLLTGGVGVFFAAVQGAVVTYVALFSHDVLGVDAVTAGLFLSLVNIAGAIGRPAYGIIGDRLFKSRNIADLLIVSMTTCIAISLLSLLPTHMSLFLIGSTIVVLGFGALGWNGVFLAIAGEHSDQGYEGVGTSFAFSLAMVGQIFGAPMFGFIVQSTGSFDLAFRIYALLLFLASIVYTITWRYRQHGNVIS